MPHDRARSRLVRRTRRASAEPGESMGSPNSWEDKQHMLYMVDAAEFGPAADALRQSGARAIEERHVGNAIELWAVLGDSAASTAFVDRWRSLAGKG